MPRRQLLLVVVGVAAGPLDPGSGLTGTLHYKMIYVNVDAKGGAIDPKREVPRRRR